LLGVMAIYWGQRHFEEMTYFRSLAVRGQKLGIDVMVFSPEDADEGKHKVHGLMYSTARKAWVRSWRRFPDIVYDRCRNQASPKFHQLREFRSKHPELIYLNRPLSNKWRVHQALSKNKDIRRHLPYTEPYSKVSELARLLRRKNPLYLKPINGTGGRGILRIGRLANGRFSIQGRDPYRKIINPQTLSGKELAVKLNSWVPQGKYIMQQGIDLTLPNGRVHDFRLLIQKNGDGEWNVTGCAGRVGPRRSVTSNLHGGGMAVPVDRLLSRRFSSSQQVEEIKRSMERLSHMTVQYLERTYGKLCELGLDIAVDPKGHVWLLEINPKPSREVFRQIGEKETYTQAISRPLQYAMWVFKQRKSG
jgi:hypothetical protein